ncbi:MAG TPA: VOC family protein [Kofleriaceae bacterium]|jgi:hypothetical protein|nr:VOC family protein [Kofleriaceae bacterium]
MTAPCCVDHIVVTAPDLAVGVKYVSDTLGVAMQPGGEHPQMATHNWLLRLGDAVFLEVIAPNPAAPRPPRRRWYALDDQTPATLPRLAGWVARATDARAVVAAASEPLGHVEPLRRGALRWLLSVPPDGSLPMGGAAPMVIEWHTDGHIASGLHDVGCSLRALHLYHPEAHRLEAVLRSIGFDDAAVVVSPLPAGELPYLLTEIETPGGPRRLGG